MIGNLKNCPQCGKLYVYSGRYLCPDCIAQEEEDFLKVRKYVRDHPGAGIIEVSEETEIEEEKILQFLRDGRLYSQGIAAALSCENCGGAINSGRYCDACLRELDKGLLDVIKAGSKPAEITDRLYNRERMYIKNSKKK